MTIDELIALAGEAREDLGGDAQVRIAYQLLRGTRDSHGLTCLRR